MSLLTNTINILIIIARIAFFTLLERKILGYSQSRKGPNKIRLSGLLQPAGDGVKLFTKETTILSSSNNYIFLRSPLIALMLAILFWSLSPNFSQSHWLHYPIPLFLCISRLAVYPIMLAGWASNTKYSLVGAHRRVAQTVSYEVRMALILVTTLIIYKSFKLTFLLTDEFKIWDVFPILPIIWFRTALAETNRSPYDLAEGERELVSGFNTEYGGPEFAFIFIAEYLNILFISMLTALIFTSPEIVPWFIGFSWYTIVIAAGFIIVRTSFPRLRYDRLINITWTSYLPLSLILIIFFAWI